MADLMGSVEDYVAAESPVRFIDAFVDDLDLGEAGLRRYRTKAIDALLDVIDAAGHLPHAVLDLHPIRRIATVEEVAAAVSYLVSPMAGYTGGTVIDVSGGVLV